MSDLLSVMGVIFTAMVIFDLALIAFVFACEYHKRWQRRRRRRNLPTLADVDWEITTDYENSPHGYELVGVPDDVVWDHVAQEFVHEEDYYL